MALVFMERDRRRGHGLMVDLEARRRLYPSFELYKMRELDLFLELEKRCGLSSLIRLVGVGSLLDLEW